jgi:hypothetical protein
LLSVVSFSGFPVVFCLVLPFISRLSLSLFIRFPQIS